MAEPITKKSEMRFQSMDALKTVDRVIKDADAALNDTSRTMRNSPVSEVLSGALGAGAGGAVSFVALSSLGVSGLSAAGITSGLATAGALVGGGMAAGIAVLAAPAVILGGIGVGIASHHKMNKLISEKMAIYKEAVAKQNALLKALQHESRRDKERINYLKALNNALVIAIRDLQYDLGIAA